MSKKDAQFSGRPSAKPQVRPSVRSGSPGEQPDETLVSRRKFLYGAIGAGALAAVGAGALAMRSSSEGEAPTVSVGDVEIPVLDVPESALVTLDNLKDLEEAKGAVQLVGNFELPYGTLIWVTDDSVAACLLPTETGSPLTQIGLFSLGSGTMSVAVDKPVGIKEHFEIYDVRATSDGLIWTEANVLDGNWRIYAAKTQGNAPGKAILLEEGNDVYETPTLAVSGSKCFWQVLPKAPNTDGLPSRLMSATFGSGEATCVYESARRMGTPPYSADGSIVITPRVDTSTVYYQLTNIDAKSGQVTDQITLPHAMAPLEAGYGANGFAFSFPDIYDYGGAIANLGTYTPVEKPQDGNYSAAKWFGFARTPSAAPAWCQNLLIVKSTYSVCAVDLKAGTYIALDVDDGADSYGDYLASSGTHDTFVTYTNIDHEPVNAKAVHACRVKVWSPSSDAALPQSDESEGEEWEEEPVDEEGQDQTLQPQTVVIGEDADEAQAEQAEAEAEAEPALDEGEMLA